MGLRRGYIRWITYGVVRSQRSSHFLRNLTSLGVLGLVRQLGSCGFSLQSQDA